MQHVNGSMASDENEDEDDNGDDNDEDEYTDDDKATDSNDGCHEHNEQGFAIVTQATFKSKKHLYTLLAKNGSVS